MSPSTPLTPDKGVTGGWLFTGQQDAGHTTRNRQAYRSVYDVPTAILAGGIGFGPKTDLAFSSSPKRQMVFGQKSVLLATIAVGTP